MTTALDTRLIPKIATIIAAKGKLVSFEVETGGTLNQLTGVPTAGTTTTYAVRVSPPSTPQGSRSAFASELARDSLASSGALEFYIAAQGLLFTPTKGVTVVIDAVDWKIEAIQPIRTGDEIGAYRVLVVR